MQGVGFRPYVHRLATSRNLAGFVHNEPGGLLISVQGAPDVLDDFVTAIAVDPPPLAVIRRVTTTRGTVEPLADFTIVNTSDLALPRPASSAGESPAPVATFVPPDVATCAACIAELFDTSNRRYRYPFITCTDCGPRLTILKALPYDRPNTTMAAFQMCESCRREYAEPTNRRFHAQPIACAACGPTMEMRWTDGSRGAAGREAIELAAEAIRLGKLVAIKGLGGYHIACDAGNPDAVATLRRRKHREARPFAVMVRDIHTASELCHVSVAELKVLESPARPILLLRRKRDQGLQLDRGLEEAAPGTSRLGVMLPYTPLHHVLLDAVRRPLVMTSGNISDEPIIYDDADALQRLAPIVDAILAHNRSIVTRCDDSVMFMMRNEPAFIRRSRGFVPSPIETVVRFPQHVLAVGAQLKNTICIARDHTAFLSHHIGDLHTAASYDSLLEGIRHYSGVLGIEPAIVAHDLHPDYQSTHAALELGVARTIAVQHHHAHVASCMAENGLQDSVLGVVFDGAGLGADGAIWGGEFLLVNERGYERVAHLQYVPLPGGDAAARRPLRMAFAHLWSACGRNPGAIPHELTRRLRSNEMLLLGEMLEKGVNSPPTSSVGRMFDAVSALAGLRDVAQFEGQAAMELEAIADEHCDTAYEMEIREDGSVMQLDPGSVMRRVIHDLLAGVGPAAISAAFHNGLAVSIAATAARVRESTGVNRVALTGGVFQNVLLLTRSVAALERAGFTVFTHRKVPCNDGGLSLGQAYVVALRGGEL